MKQIPDLDVDSALLLLERSLVLKDDKLEFTRDNRLKIPVRDIQIKNNIF